jgi:hypothetical protein
MILPISIVMAGLIFLKPPITKNLCWIIPCMSWKKCLTLSGISASAVLFMYLSIASIDKIDDYFGNRLILQLKPVVDKEALVSREKVTDFKKWIGK